MSNFAVEASTDAMNDEEYDILSFHGSDVDISMSGSELNLSDSDDDVLSPNGPATSELGPESPDGISIRDMNNSAMAMNSSSSSGSISSSNFIPLDDDLDDDEGDTTMAGADFIVESENAESKNAESKNAESENKQSEDESAKDVKTTPKAKTNLAQSSAKFIRVYLSGDYTPETRAYMKTLRDKNPHLILSWKDNSTGQVTLLSSQHKKSASQRPIESMRVSNVAVWSSGSFGRTHRSAVKFSKKAAKSHPNHSHVSCRSNALSSEEVSSSQKALKGKACVRSAGFPEATDYALFEQCSSEAKSLHSNGIQQQSVITSGLRKGLVFSLLSAFVVATNFLTVCAYRAYLSRQNSLPLAPQLSQDLTPELFRPAQPYEPVTTIGGCPVKNSPSQTWLVPQTTDYTPGSEMTAIECGQFTIHVDKRWAKPKGGSSCGSERGSSCASKCGSKCGCARNDVAGFVESKSSSESKKIAEASTAAKERIAETQSKTAELAVRSHGEVGRVLAPTFMESHKLSMRLYAASKAVLERYGTVSGTWLADHEVRFSSKYRNSTAGLKTGTSDLKDTAKAYVPNNDFVEDYITAPGGEGIAKMQDLVEKSNADIDKMREETSNTGLRLKDSLENSAFAKGAAEKFQNVASFVKRGVDNVQDSQVARLASSRLREFIDSAQRVYGQVPREH